MLTESRINYRNVQLFRKIDVILQVASPKTEDCKLHKDANNLFRWFSSNLVTLSVSRSFVFKAIKLIPTVEPNCSSTVYFRAIRLAGGKEVRGRELKRCERTSLRMLPDETEVETDVISGNGSRGWNREAKKTGGERKRGKEKKKNVDEKGGKTRCMRVGLRQRPFVREWVRICVSYNIYTRCAVT